jgi:putative DNA primase/helicase
VWLHHYYRHDDGLVQRARVADILAAAQGLTKLRRVSSSEWAGACPRGCARRDGFIIHPGKRLFLCRPSGNGGDVIAMIEHALGCGFREACEYITGEPRPGGRSSPVRAPKPTHDESEYAIRMREAAFRIWTASSPIAQTIGERYFRSRAITGPLPTELRFMSELEHWPTRQMLPAIVARVNAVDGAFLGVHLTFLTDDGCANTALGDKRKLVLGSIRGGAVRLAEPAGGELMVAEGIETSLSVAEATGCPVWSALSTSGLKTLELPAGVTSVTIAADGDDPGADAAASAERRWRAEGRRVRIRSAPPGLDFNDLAQAHARMVAMND